MLKSIACSVGDSADVDKQLRNPAAQFGLSLFYPSPLLSKTE